MTMYLVEFKYSCLDLKGNPSGIYFYSLSCFRDL